MYFWLKVNRFKGKFYIDTFYGIKFQYYTYSETCSIDLDEGEGISVFYAHEIVGNDGSVTGSSGFEYITAEWQLILYCVQIP